MSKHHFGRSNLHPGRWTLIFLTAAGLLVASEARPDVLDGLVVVSAAADFYTTERALKLPGLYETNSTMDSRGARLGLHLLGLGMTIGIPKHFERTGHKRAAKVAKIGFILLWSGAAVNNHIQARRAR